MANSINLLEAALKPLTTDNLKDHYSEGKCLVLEGNSEKFTKLVTPADIERRLNDGCNANTFAQVIKDGTRGADTNSNAVWSPAALRKSQFAANIQTGYSFMMPNSSQITPAIAKLCDDIEAYFADEHVHADVHLYVSTSGSGNSYNAHRDLPQHKLLLQAYGDTNWQIFNPIKEIPGNLTAVTEDQQEELLELASEFTLKQGDLLYMPPGTFHRVVSVSGPRISVSIPFYSMDKASKMDRSYIPFREIFESD